jgi:hypothetical protein
MLGGYQFMWATTQSAVEHVDSGKQLLDLGRGVNSGMQGKARSSREVVDLGIWVF